MFKNLFIYFNLIVVQPERLMIKTNLIQYGPHQARRDWDRTALSTSMATHATNNATVSLRGS